MGFQDKLVMAIVTWLVVITVIKLYNEKKEMRKREIQNI